MEGFNTPLQVPRYYVTGVFDGAVYRGKEGAPDFMVMFGWMMFGEIIG